jgi:DNA-binding response OmpR family regulator
MTKPFELSEFEARVRALLRRGQASVIRLGRLEWFWDRREAFIDEVPLALSRQEISVLEALVQRPGRIVAKDVLTHRLGENGEVAGDNLVEVYIHRLRRKLGEADVAIRTVRGLGYRLQVAAGND